MTSVSEVILITFLRITALNYKKKIFIDTSHEWEFRNKIRKKKLIQVILIERVFFNFKFEFYALFLKILYMYIFTCFRNVHFLKIVVYKNSRRNIFSSKLIIYLHVIVKQYLFQIKFTWLLIKNKKILKVILQKLHLLMNNNNNKNESLKIMISFICVKNNI